MALGTYRGLGQSSAQIASTIGVSLAKIAPVTGVAAPFVAAAAGIASLVGAAFALFSGCGQTCVQASDYANQAENILNQIKSTYFGTQTPRAQSFQTATLQSIQQIFNWLQQVCSQPNLGSAGQRCISERLVQGGSAPWCPDPGGVGCDWITNYYVPIATDPNVVPDSQLSTSSTSGTTSGSTSMVPLLIAAAAIVMVFVL